MEPETIAAEPTDRIPIVSVLRSPAILSTNLSGLLLLICMFLPLSEGCDNKVVYPGEVFQSASGSTLADRAMFASHFGYGLIVGATLIAIGIVQKRWFLKGIVCAELSILAVVAIGVFVPELWHANVKEFVGWTLTLLPPSLAALVWIGGSIRRGDWVQAWGRLHMSLAMYLIVWIHFMCIFAQRLLAGYYVFLVSVLTLMASIEWSVQRMEHDLLDRSRSIGKFQFSVKRIFVWTTVLALTLGYYQSLDRIMRWIFG
jgi:hypothetical protein